MTRTAACSCGQLRVTVNGKPGSVGACSCRDCQKSTGSVFGISAGNFADPNFEPPGFAFWSETQHPWVRFPEGCQVNQRQ